MLDMDPVNENHQLIDPLIKGSTMGRRTWGTTTWSSTRFWAHEIRRVFVDTNLNAEIAKPKIVFEEVDPSKPDLRT